MTKILDFVEDKSNYFALLFLLIFFFAAFFSVQGKFWEGLKFSGFALTSDEVSHIPAGFYYLKTRQYFINAEHPPLIKDIAAIPLLFLNLNLPQIPENLRYENIQWDFGNSFLFKVGNNPDLIAFCSRTIIILFNVFLLFLVYYFLRKVFGSLPALISLFFLVFSPNFTAHGGLVVFDVPLALLSIISILTFSLFLKGLTENKKDWKIFFLSAAFTSLALLTKFQGVFLVLGLFSGGLIYILFSKKEFLGKYLLVLIMFSILILAFIGIIYGFQTMNMTVKGIQHQLGYSYPDKFPLLGEKILSWLLSFNILPINGVVEYLIGILMMVSRTVGAWQSTYFLGKVYGSEGASLLYFPILFLTKETLGFLILLVLAVLFSGYKFLKGFQIKQKIKNFLKNPFNSLSLSFFLIYVLFSLTLRLNIGIRHIFPIIFLLYAIVAKQVSQWLRSNAAIFKKEVKVSFFVVLFFLFIVISWILSWPYFLSYYNVLAGGTWNGYKIATDSNYDWGGQDVKRLGKWVKENKIEKIYTHIFSNVQLNYYLGDAYQKFNIREDSIPPSNSLLAVSTFELQNVNYDSGLPESKKYSQFEKNLVERIGTTIFIFKIP